MSSEVGSLAQDRGKDQLLGGKNGTSTDDKESKLNHKRREKTTL